MHPARPQARHPLLTAAAIALVILLGAMLIRHSPFFASSRASMTPSTQPTRAPAAFLTMWDHSTIDVESVGDPLDHAAGRQYRDVIPGDTIYLVTVRNGILELGGRIIVGEVTDQAGAAKALGNRAIIDAPYHLLAAKGTVAPLRAQEIHDLAPQLRFTDSPAQLVIEPNGMVTAYQLLPLRPLTPESAKLLQAR